MAAYVVPKADQYEMAGSIYFQLSLPSETGVLTVYSKGAAPASQKITLRGLHLSDRILKLQGIDNLRSIAKHILGSHGKMKKNDLIAFILANMLLEE